MKKIPLTQGKETMVDDDVYEWAKDYKWYASKGRHTFYAIKMMCIDGQRKSVRLSHAIMGFPLNNLKVDHIDGNGLNNQRSNLRIVTNRQNLQNQLEHRNGRLVGVKLQKDHFRKKPWRALIRINGKRINLGSFATQEEANAMYIQAAELQTGERHENKN